MYAVIETGGKQYRVELGSEIRVDRLDVQPGDAITLDRVLLVADDEAAAVGRPLVDGASVTARVVRQDRGDKVTVFKYKQKARTRVKKGFRAELTTLRIADIAYSGRSAAEDAKEAESEKAKAAKDAQMVAARKAAADKELAAQLAAASETPTTESSMDEPSGVSVAKPGAKARARPRAKPAAKAKDDSKPAAAPKPVADAQADQAADVADTKKDE